MHRQKKIYSCFVASFIFFGNVVLAQVTTENTSRLYMDPLNIYQGQNEEINATANLNVSVEANSNALTNSFVKGIFFQGFVTDQQKDDVSARLKKNNRFGYEINAGLSGTFHRENLTWIAGVNYRENLNASFSKDPFELLFRGNKNYAGRTAVLNPTHLNYYSYESIFIGVTKQPENTNVIFGGGISILNGLQFQQINIQRGTLYTAVDGEYIDVSANFDVSYSQNKVSQGPLSNGAGLAANLMFTGWTEKSRFNVELRDFGFMDWKKMNTSAKDSSFRYEGAEIQNILQYQNYTFHGLQADSLKKQFHVAENISNKTKWVPFTVNMNYSFTQSQKLRWMLGMKYMAFSSYLPLTYLKMIWNIRQRFMFVPGLQYGGYGKFNLQLSAVKSFNNKFILSANVMCLEYLLVPAKTSGLGAQLTLSKVF